MRRLSPEFGEDVRSFRGSRRIFDKCYCSSVKTKPSAKIKMDCGCIPPSRGRVRRRSYVRKLLCQRDFWLRVTFIKNSPDAKPAVCANYILTVLNCTYQTRPAGV